MGNAGFENRDQTCGGNTRRYTNEKEKVEHFQLNVSFYKLMSQRVPLLTIQRELSQLHKLFEVSESSHPELDCEERLAQKFLLRLTKTKIKIFVTRRNKKHSGRLELWNIKHTGLVSNTGK